LAIGVESRAGESAEILFPDGGIHRVRISPTGDWIIAYAVSENRHGILAQQTATGETFSVFSTMNPLRRMDWIDRNTMVAEFHGPFQRRTMVVRFRTTRNGAEFDTDWIQPIGWMVDPLPLVGEEVIWAIGEGDRQALHRVEIQNLIDYGKRGRGRRRQLTGTRLALVEGDIERWIVDRNGDPRAVQRRDEEGYTILVRDEGETRFREVYSFKDREHDSEIKLLSLSSDQRQIIVSAYGGNDTLGLFEFDPATGKLGESLFHRDEVDIANIVVDPMSHELIAAVYHEAGETRYHYFPSYGGNLVADLSERFPKESVAIVSSSANRQSFVFWISGATNPGAYYYRGSRSGAPVRISERGPNIDRGSLIEASSFIVKSRDGTEIEAFLTMPNLNRGQAAPLVVKPHGGPIGVRDSKRYDPLVQYLASWGFAVLQPNYRGSSGYGKKFRDSGKKAWAKGIEDDIDAAVEHVMSLAEIDASRVCILGGSYGGFSAIASVVRHKERYRCAVSLNGVSDIPLLYDSSDMADSKRAMDFYEEFVGDLETEREKLIAVSPAYHVKEIETPLFMVYGTADRRVDPDHSERMLLMLETYGKEHDSMKVEGMAHSPEREEWVTVARAIRRYLARFLFPSEEYRSDPDPDRKS